MTWLYDLLINPFVEFNFMRRALMGALLLSLSACPVGVFLTLRRMSLVGDAMSHAVLPGAAFGFLLYGLEIIPMTLGGMVAGLVVAIGSGVVSRLTVQKEDASMAAFYLISLALGVLIVSLRGSSVDLMHVLFGSVLALNVQALTLIACVSATSLLALGLLWRALIAECLDPLFLRTVSRLSSPVHFLFLTLVVINLVAGYQALGTLLSVGLMILPAVTARFWTHRVITLCLFSVLIGMVACVTGLLFSYHYSLPSGPAIILANGVFYLVSTGLVMMKNTRRPSHSSLVNTRASRTE
ncbi:metal ABC transporter permease [Pectobacterium sp. PL64]|uniref:zinc ABC transporter permease AztB n=1 Tax=Pectobacterium sp. PL64 TaxID=2738983 RepID=UPI001F0B99B6|nr:zinc ABC transporter permease AztB [Pectobacterium sp. PL64]UMO89009.1 metal ABC transporter permease [Pectobacterium sp. PL64]